MNWTLVLIGFSLAVLMGAGWTKVLAQLRPQWSARRRMLTAASFLPVITLIITAVGVVWAASLDHPGGGDMRDLAARAIAVLGFAFTCMALVGGLIGAGLAQRKRPR